MKSVWKKAIPLSREGNTENIILDLPKGAGVKHFAVQYGVPTIWIIADINSPIVKRRFSLRGTGVSFHDCEQGAYVGSIHMGNQMHAQEFVFHLFDHGEVED